MLHPVRNGFGMRVSPDTKSESKTTVSWKINIYSNKQGCCGWIPDNGFHLIFEWSG